MGGRRWWLAGLTAASVLWTIPVAGAVPLVTPDPTSPTTNAPSTTSSATSSSPSAPETASTEPASPPATPAAESRLPTPVPWRAQPQPTPRLKHRAVRVEITSPTNTTADALGTTTITGRVTPAQVATVRLEVQRGTSWSMAREVTTNAAGSFSALVPDSGGALITQTWRVRWRVTGGEVSSPNVTVRRIAVLNLTQRQATAADVPKTYRAGCPVPPSQLTRLDFTHYDFAGRVRRGHWIVRTTHVHRFRAAATTQFTSKFPIRQAGDPSRFGTDEVSMSNNNSYAFFCRQVVGNPYARSPHSYGHAIDINPWQNPYRTPAGAWLPSTEYVSRSPARPGMLFASTPLVKTLLGQGFDWYSGWDWHHFQVKR